MGLSLFILVSRTSAPPDETIQNTSRYLCRTVPPIPHTTDGGWASFLNGLTWLGGALRCVCHTTLAKGLQFLIAHVMPRSFHNTGSPSWVGLWFRIFLLSSGPLCSIVSRGDTVEENKLKEQDRY
ncbi:hypothetical protein, unlikely [Trypanosoma congolense IL3000]|uniref:Uncharacterized protein n=1 Tax=Trypanosoma congolense (strain IL3000) TaxID=1068625 RepID=F9W7E9_TRYCI|nr:hypothetical protein, unlikely [Trypanosoma congolense IL3000]